MVMKAPVVGPVGPGYAQSYRRERARELSVSGKQEAQDWAETVRKFGERNGVTYEPVGGINPKDGPVALCVGGGNRLTGQLVEGFWGSSCDADEKEVGGLFGKALVPTAILAKAHMPDLAKVVPAFNVESREPRLSPSTSSARWNSSRSTSTSASSRRCRRSMTRSPFASSSAPASSSGRRR
jgi:hypothetical protein